MAYQVRYTSTLKDGAPAYDEWVANLNLDTLGQLPVNSKYIPYYLDAVEEFKRLIGTKTAQQLLNEKNEKILDPASGYVSSNLVDNVLIEEWETSDAYTSSQKKVKNNLATGTISFVTGSATISGIGTTFISEIEVTDDIYIIQNGDEVQVGTVESIESDTELTLANPTLVNDASDTVFRVYENQLMLNFLRQVYNALYVDTTDILTTEI